jgi:uncharacterized protein
LTVRVAVVAAAGGAGGPDPMFVCRPDVVGGGGVPGAEPAGPLQVMVKPVGPACNLACAYCYYLGKHALFPPGEDLRMPGDVLERFVREHIRASPGPQVPFVWQGGEPTLLGLDFFRQVVALQGRYLPPGWTARNALQTNGTLLDEDWCAFLREHGFLVGLSLDGPAPLHDGFRRDKLGRPTQAAVLRGLRLLQRYGVEHNVLCVVHRDNARRPLEVYRYLRGLGVSWIQFIPLVEPAAGGGVSPRSVRPEDFGAFLIAVFEEWVRHDIGRVFVQLFEECAAVWAGLPASLCVLQETCGRCVVMEHNGDLYACDHFVRPEYRLGNLATLDLASLAADPRLRSFGAAKRDSLPRQCRACEVRFICQGGCPKDRLARTPDGEPGLNYLCAGYRRFFRHIDPYMRRLAALWREGRDPARLMAELRREQPPCLPPGRNDPCPCGSGRKYKHCCGAAPSAEAGQPCRPS